MTCGGTGCDECKNEGRYKLTSCPKNDLPADLGDFLQAAKWMEKGLPPVQGGSQDQSHWFLEACGFLANEHATIEAEEHERRCSH